MMLLYRGRGLGVLPGQVDLLRGESLEDQDGRRWDIEAEFLYQDIIRGGENLVRTAQQPYLSVKSHGKREMSNLTR